MCRLRNGGHFVSASMCWQRISRDLDVFTFLSQAGELQSFRSFTDICDGFFLLKYVVSAADISWVLPNLVLKLLSMKWHAEYCAFITGF